MTGRELDGAESPHDARHRLHRLNNALQMAMGDAELLVESAHALGVPSSFRRDLASVLDRLDLAAREAVGLQRLLVADQGT